MVRPFDGLVLILAVGTAPLVACDGEPRSTPDGRSVREALAALTTPAEHARGESAYVASCESCHGPRASGSPAGPPLVDPIYRPAHHADAAFQLAVIRGVRAHHWDFGDMTALPGVEPDVTAEITAYVRWLQRQVGIR